MNNRIYVFDSHPVQYKAPVYQAMAEIDPNLFEVIYATDASVRGGNIDQGFGVEVKWDTPLLTGHNFRVLNNEKGKPLSTPSSLTGKGIFALLRKERPRAVMLTQARYHFDHVAYFSALALNIPILIRQETQDEMFSATRGILKQTLRYLAYRITYAPIKHAFCFGELNRQHLTRHGIRPSQMSTAHFSVPDPLKKCSEVEKVSFRQAVRALHGIPNDATVIAFFGKLIPKKNPGLIYEALNHALDSTLKNVHLLFVGSGELEADLRLKSEHAKKKWGVNSTFAGFVNQSTLPHYYLASDIVTLPSKRMGEAWGLVVNEALSAGCSVVISDAVGCRPEFENWERVRVIPEGNSSELARAFEELNAYPREFNWARPAMEAYSTEAAANELVRVFRTFSQNQAE